MSTLLRHALAASLTTLTLAAHAQAPAAPRVDAAWARPTVAGQTAGGGFMTITGSAMPDKLLSASSAAAQAVELHTMTMDGSVMRMRRIDGLDVAAGQKLELKPGGMHLMLVGLKAPLQPGATVPVVLKFQQAGDVQVNLQVAASAPGMPGATGVAGGAAASAAAADPHAGHKH